MTLSWPLAPMKGKAATDLPVGDEWITEPKWDGHRALVRWEGGDVDVRSSSGARRDDGWPFVADALAGAVAAGMRQLILDGEVVAVGEDGRHSFQSVGRADSPHALVVFDLLELDGTPLVDRPWHERRALLDASIRSGPGLIVTPWSTDAAAMWEATKAQGFEGVMAKRRDGRYLPGKRSTTWLKVKHRRQQEVVVGGFLAGSGSRAATFGSLLVGVHDDGALRPAGAVGSGLDERTIGILLPRLRALEVSACQFEPEPALGRRLSEARWVRPEIVVQVAFAEWTEEGRLRHPVFLEVRDDVDAADVVREP